MAFHRLTDPTYYGGLPGGYDFINNLMSGVPAPADGVRPSGPNAGTYFVGFGEDGRAPAANRGLKALAQNTDLLDDLMRRDLGITKVLLATAGGGGVSSINLTGPLWAGLSGTPNTVAGIRTFLALTDENDNEIYVGSAECQITAITGATPGDEWVGNITLTVSPPIPAATSYKVFYYQRKNVAVIDEDAIVRERKYNMYSPGPAWADSTTNPLNTVKGQLDKIINDLAGVGGANKIGGDALSGTPFSVVAETVQAQLGAILDSLNAFVALLADPGTPGATLVGAAAVAGGAYPFASGTVDSQLAEIHAALDDLFDRFTEREDVILVGGTWTFPDGVYLIEVEGCGGGGSGGGGSPGSTIVANTSTGGGGGGAAQKVRYIVSGNPGDVITTVIGAGGTSVATTAAGIDGSSSLFGAYTFPGGSGGSSTTSSGNSNACMAYGGPPFILTAAQRVFYPNNSRAIYTTAPQLADILRLAPGQGGGGLNQGGVFATHASIDGMPSLEGYLGGVGGGHGSYGSGDGGGGGGGGGGPYGVGGDGGTGGDGFSGGPAADGGAVSGATAGIAAGDNTGGGGGGGGGGGSSTGGAGTGYISGAGGSGRLVVRYRGPQAVIT